MDTQIKSHCSKNEIYPYFTRRQSKENRKTSIKRSGLKKSKYRFVTLILKIVLRK